MTEFVADNTLVVALVFAFGLGLGARQIGLPPLVGFLAAGFVLNTLGVRSDATIQAVADFGVTLLLFTIGLKLKIKTLLKPEVWGTASLHAAITTAVFGLLLLALAATDLPLIAGLSTETALLIAFALSFSSTVFAVKILEDKGELGSLQGRTAIGILIMQDILAVVFLTLSTGKTPSIWAIALVGLVFVRPVLGYLLDRVGHGELVPLFGFFAAIALGVELFELVDLKSDLGALVFGMLLANHKKAVEIADSLFSFKEILLVGFFLNIGLSGMPSLEALAIALGLVFLILLKSALFFALFTRFHLRARTALLASLVLSNYSEFGLIVGTIGVGQGWIGAEWLTTIAVALAASFVIGAPFNKRAHDLSRRFQRPLARFETPARHPEEEVVDTGDALVLIIGMGRIGTGAYDYIREHQGDVVVGLDVDAEKVARHAAAGRNVILGDATDASFWQRKTMRKINVVMLAMPEHRANMFALEQLRSASYSGFVAALAQFPDRVEPLEAAGANVAFAFHSEAGAGFAAHVLEKTAVGSGLGTPSPS